jgi:Amt family ammonium transporter
MGCLMLSGFLALPPSLRAEEPAKPVASIPGQMTVELFYDKAVLEKAAADAEPGEDGSKTGTVQGTVVKNFPGGLSETSPAIFQLVLDKDGKPGEVKIAAVGNPGDLADGKGGFVSPGVFRSNNIWVLIAAALVFLMHLGFATVESGLCRAKNTVNILTKNVAIVCIGVLTYWAWGYNAMYPGSAWTWTNVFAIGSPLTSEPDVSAAYYGGSYTQFTDFIFQAMFAATAATIVSGAVAERIKLAPFLVFTVVFVTLAYPFTGSWKWGGGWLQAMGFHDFAGSTLVHAVGGWAALAGVILLGPRSGKFGPDGSARAIPGHSMPLATIGVLLLFLGWFGFNGGSVLSADEAGVSSVFVTTTLAGCAGGILGLLTSWFVFGKPDLSMSLNGILAGLVGITAGADVVSPGASILIGAIAGALVVFSVIFFDKIKIDDPVGAISVHGVCGIFGTVAVGIFAKEGALAGLYGEPASPGLLTQIIGTLVISATSFLISFTIFAILKAAGGIRVSSAEEAEGLDVGEHGMKAYHLDSAEVVAN